MIKKHIIITLSALLMLQQSYSQRTTITFGPVLTLGKNSLDKDGRKGFGFGAEITHRLVANSSARLYIGKETFHTPGMPENNIDYLSLRTGYQLFFLSRKITCWGDAGVVIYRHPFFGSDNSLSFSAGGGYNMRFGRMAIAQTQLFYTYNLKADPFKDGTPGGWITLRLAVGIGTGGKQRKDEMTSL